VIPHSVYDCSGVPVFYICRHQKPCYTFKSFSHLHCLSSISLCSFTASRYSRAPERREQAYPALGFMTFSIIPRYSTLLSGTPLFSLAACLTLALPNICSNSPHSLRIGSLWSVWVILFPSLFSFLTTSCILLWVSYTSPYILFFSDLRQSDRSRAALHRMRSD
jgi:hypothetical protein